MSAYVRRLAPRIRGVVSMLLWAALAAWAVILISSIPRMTQARAVAERQRVQELIAETHFYCAKWGLIAGSHEHTLCTMDVQAIRTRHEQRLSDDLTF